MFKSIQKVYFYDADPAGIIFYASLFKMAHSVYEEFMKHLKLSRNYFFDEELVLPIIHTEADYLKPIKVGDEMKVDVWVSQLKKSSFELSYKFHTTKLGTKATVKTVHVCVSKRSFRKTELPKELFNKLKKHLVN